MVLEDHCVYVKKTTRGIMFLLLYVDDILLAGNNLEMINATKQWLSSVSIGIYQKSLRMLLDGLFQTRWHSNWKGLTFNLNQCLKTDKKKEKMTNVPYASPVGSLMYATLCPQPDICFAVGLVSRYQSNSGPTHWQAVKRITHYHHGTTDLVLC